MPCLLMENLVFPISLSLCMLYAFGTMDSSAVRTRADRHLGQLYALPGYTYDGYSLCEWISPCAGVILFFFFAFLAAAFGWLIGVLRDELRAIGSLDTTRVKRLFEIMGLQLALVVIGATQGHRGFATNRCDVNVLDVAAFAWLFSVAIFDVTGLDAYVRQRGWNSGPSKAQLCSSSDPCTSRLASWVLSEQNKPSRRRSLPCSTCSSSRCSGPTSAPLRHGSPWRKRRSKVSHLAKHGSFSRCIVATRTGSQRFFPFCLNAAGANANVGCPMAHADRLAT